MQLVEALGRGLPGDRIITDPDVLAAMSHDEAEWAPAGRPPPGCARGPRPRCSTSCAPAPSWAPPIVPRGAGTGLSGGANAVGGCVILDLSRMNRVLEIDPDNLRGRGPARRGQQRRQGRRRRARPVVPAGPGQRPVVHHRRQRRHQRGRPVLPEVRRHPRLRPGPARGGRRPGRLRRGRAPRPAHHQGRRRAGPGRPVRRVRGHAGRGDRGDAAAAAGAGRHAADGRRRVRGPGRVRAGRGPDHPARADPGRARASRPGLPGGGRGVEAPGHRGRRGRAAAGPGGHAGGRRARPRPRRSPRP